MAIQRLRLPGQDAEQCLQAARSVLEPQQLDPPFSELGMLHPAFAAGLQQQAASLLAALHDLHQLAAGSLQPQQAARQALLARCPAEAAHEAAEQLVQGLAQHFGVSLSPASTPGGLSSQHRQVSAPAGPASVLQPSAAGGSLSPLGDIASHAAPAGEPRGYHSLA